ncbi:MAG: hypothetical protein M0C28_19805 [Candidatus Moduliflexus flocculans]|nr:hypothetical protein [Candidatus Moduliflexus flocculans]
MGDHDDVGTFAQGERQPGSHREWRISVQRRVRGCRRRALRRPGPGGSGRGCRQPRCAGCRRVPGTAVGSGAAVGSAGASGGFGGTGSSTTGVSAGAAGGEHEC